MRTKVLGRGGHIAELYTDAIVIRNINASSVYIHLVKEEIESLSMLLNTWLETKRTEKTVV